MGLIFHFLHSHGTLEILNCFFAFISSKKKKKKGIPIKTTFFHNHSCFQFLPEDSDLWENCFQSCP